jgi:hypothetical protein
MGSWRADISTRWQLAFKHWRAAIRRSSIGKWCGESWVFNLALIAGVESFTISTVFARPGITKLNN